MGLFRKIADSLRKTRQVVAEGIQQAVRAQPKITPELYDALEEVLLRGDVGPEAAEGVLDELKERIKKGRIESSAEIPGLLREIVAEALRGSAAAEPSPSPRGPRVVLVCGVNGVGKTTTIGKLAYRYRQAGSSVLIVAADTFRAAACEQLAIWAKRAGADIVRSAAGADPASVAFDGVQAGVARAVDAVIVDTAGRLHAKGNLMDELKKIHRVVGKAEEGAPHEVLLVLDATVGQNGLAQASSFLEAAGVTGLVLAKVDGTAKGGVILAIARKTKLPVRYVGTGEGIEDLEPFDPEAFATGLIQVDADAVADADADEDEEDRATTTS
ncbi:MAG: signal recognition particle-docking protein FtsY [Candidatus Eisenbacteria bacterium]